MFLLCSVVFFAGKASAGMKEWMKCGTNAMSDGMTALAWVLYKSWWCERIEVRNIANTTTTAEGVGKKTKRNIAKTMTARLAWETRRRAQHNKRRFAPFINILWGLRTPYWGLRGQKKPRMTTERTLGGRKQGDTLAVSTKRSVLERNSIVWRRCLQGWRKKYYPNRRA